MGSYRELNDLKGGEKKEEDDKTKKKKGETFERIFLCPVIGRRLPESLSQPARILYMYFLL